MNYLMNYNLKLINNQIEKKFGKTNNQSKQFRKNMCRNENKNIFVVKNNHPNKENTIFFISISELNKGKLFVMLKIIQSNYNCIIGFDNKYYKNSDELNSKIKEFSNFIKETLKSNIESFLSVEKFPLDNNYLLKTYGEKIINFNGKWANNPSKLGCLDWLFHNKNNYEYMWYIEDDLLCKDVNALLDKYNKYNDDLICTIDEYHLPDWFYTKWKVGDTKHGFDLSHLYIARYSKQFVTKFFEYMKITNTTSHHEIFIPYVLNYYHLSFKNLEKDDTRNLHLNNHSTTKIYNLSNIHNSESILFHPFKI